MARKRAQRLPPNLSNRLMRAVMLRAMVPAVPLHLLNMLLALVVRLFSPQWRANGAPPRRAIACLQRTQRVLADALPAALAEAGIAPPAFAGEDADCALITWVNRAQPFGPLSGAPAAKPKRALPVWVAPKVMPTPAPIAGRLAIQGRTPRARATAPPSVQQNQSPPRFAASAPPSAGAGVQVSRP
jgi:hypothetical protein